MNATTVFLREKVNLLLNYRFPKLFSKSKFLSGLFYAFFSRAFAREHQAVLQGKIRHLHEAYLRHSSDYLLVRNIHRIEKGLLMRPRKPVFAQKYLSETLNCFETVYHTACSENREQIRWFHDVLELYFQVTGPDEIIDRERRRFQRITRHQTGGDSSDIAGSNTPDTTGSDTPDIAGSNAPDIAGGRSPDTTGSDTPDTPDRIVSENTFAATRPSSAAGAPGISESKSVPCERKHLETHSVTFEQFYALSRQRRSVRWFSRKKVHREDIDRCLAAAAYSPSACNRQPFTFYLVDEPEQLSRITKLPMGTQGYDHNIPVFLVVVGNLEAYFSERDRHLIYIDASLACMSLMLALETAGLSSCPINWPDIEGREKKMQKLLGLQPFQRPVMCMAIGYADPEGLVAHSEKKSLDRMRIWITKRPGLSSRKSEPNDHSQP